MTENKTSEPPKYLLLELGAELERADEGNIVWDHDTKYRPPVAAVVNKENAGNFYRRYRLNEELANEFTNWLKDRDEKAF